MKNNYTLDDPLQNFWLQCHQTCNLLSRCEEAAFASIGISPQHIGVLLAIKHIGNPVTISKVANYMDRDVNAVSMTVNRMEKAGLVIRNRDLPDHRSVRLLMTEKGQKIFGQTEKIAIDLAHSVLSDFTENDIEQAARFMHKMRASARREMQKHKNQPRR